MKAIIVLLFGAATVFAIDVTAVLGVNKPYLDERAGFAAGAAIRIPVTERLSVRPELLWSSIPNYVHVFALGSVIYDFSDPSKPAVGYVIGSAGASHLRERSFFRNTEFAWQGGAGVRFNLPGSWVSSAELRIGPAAIPLTTFSIGYTWNP